MNSITKIIALVALIVVIVYLAAFVIIDMSGYNMCHMLGYDYAETSYDLKTTCILDKRIRVPLNYELGG